MALRIFSDANGEEWRVWPVTPSTGADTLMASFQGGWLCFERTDGSDRRRLSLTQVPPAWDALPDHQLDQLCQRAERAMMRAGPASSGDPRTLESRQRDLRHTGPRSIIGGDDSESGAR